MFFADSDSDDNSISSQDDFIFEDSDSDEYICYTREGYCVCDNRLERCQNYIHNGMDCVGKNRNPNYIPEEQSPYGNSDSDTEEEYFMNTLRQIPSADVYNYIRWYNFHSRNGYEEKESINSHLMDIPGNLRDERYFGIQNRKRKTTTSFTLRRKTKRTQMRKNNNRHNKNIQLIEIM